MEEQQWWTPGTFDSRPPTGGEQLGALKDLLTPSKVMLFGSYLKIPFPYYI